MTTPSVAGLHIACIMDGNGRWASRRGLPRTDGHTAGEEALADSVRAAADRPVKWLTAFGFGSLARETTESQAWGRYPSAGDDESRCATTTWPSSAYS